MPDLKEDSTHTELVDYMSSQYYDGGKKDEIRAKMLSDPKAFDFALKDVHKNTSLYSEMPFEDFKNKYTNKFGNPFQEKKNSTQNSVLVPKPLPKEPGNTFGTSASFNSLGDALNAKPVTPEINPDKIKDAATSVMQTEQKENIYGDIVPKQKALPVKPEFDFAALDKLKTKHELPDNLDPVQEAQELAKVPSKAKKNYELAVEADKQGQQVFTDADGKEQPVAGHVEKLNAIENLGVRVANAFVGGASGLLTTADLAFKYTPHGYVLNKILPVSETLKSGAKSINDSKLHLPQANQKADILENAIPWENPEAYANLFGDLMGQAALFYTTKGIGSVANLSSKGINAVGLLTTMSTATNSTYQTAKENGLSDEGADAMTIITAPVVAALDRVGMKSLLSNQFAKKLLNKIGMKTIMEVTDNFTKRFTPQMAIKASKIMQTRAGQIGTNMTTKGVTESVTEGGQTGYELGVQEAYNRFFEKKYDTSDWLHQLKSATASGLAGGVGVGVISTTKSKSELNSKRSEILAGLELDPETNQPIMTPDAEAQLADVDNQLNAIANPEAEAPKVSKEVADLSVKKEQLLQDLNNEATHPQVKEILQQEIESVDEKLTQQIEAEQQQAEELKAKQDAVAELEGRKKLFVDHLGIENLSHETKKLLEDQIGSIDELIKTLNLDNKQVSKEGEKMEAKPVITPETPGSEEYRGQHQIVKPITTADNLSGNDTGFEWKNVKEDHDLSDTATKESHKVLEKIKDKPDAEVTIYRSVPHGVDKINEGDWITLSPTYAKVHGYHGTDSSKDLPVIEMKVKAKDLGWDGNDLNEFSYNPKNGETADQGKKPEAIVSKQQIPNSEGNSGKVDKKIAALPIELTPASKLKNSIIDRVAEHNKNHRGRNASELKRSITADVAKTDFNIDVVNGKIVLTNSKGKKPAKELTQDVAILRKEESDKVKAHQERKKVVLARPRNTADTLARGWLLDGGKLRSEQSEKDKMAGVGRGKGVKDETGMGGKEISALLGVIDNTNGISLEKAAEQIHGNLDEDVQENISEQDIRNALITVIKGEPIKSWVNQQDIETSESGEFSDEDIRRSNEYNQLSDEERSRFHDLAHQQEAQEQSDEYWDSIDIDKEAAELDEYLNSKEYKDAQSNQQTEGEQDAQNKNNEKDNKREGGKAKQRPDLESVRNKARDARNSQDPEKAKEVISEIDGILMRENIITGEDGSFADPTSDTFFDFLDQNKSVYRLSEDANIAQSPEQLQEIINATPGAKGIDISNGLSFDDAFDTGVIAQAKKMGYDGIRLLEIDGTNSTLQIWNFDKLEHIDGPEVRKSKSAAVPPVKPPVPPTPPKTEGENKKPPEKVLKVAQHILDSPDVSDETKEGLIKKGIHYVPQSNVITDGDAKSLIESHGVEGAYAMVMDSSNGMKDLARGAVARKLFESYSDQSKNATSEADRFSNLDKAVQVASFAAKMFKDAGQTVQSAKMWKRMLQKMPEGMLIAIEKDYSQNKEEALEAVNEKLKEDKKSLDDFVKENIEKVMDTSAMKEQIKRILAGQPKSKARTKKQISDFFDGLKYKNDKNKLFDVTYYVVKSAWNTALEIIKKAVLASVDVKVAVQMGIDSINSHPDQVGTWEQGKFKIEMTDKINQFVEVKEKTEFSKADIEGGLVEKVRAIAKEHYSKKVPGTLTEKITALGVEPSKAQQIADKIEGEVKKSIIASKSEILSKVSKAVNLPEAKKTDLFKDIAASLEKGPMDTETFKDIYAKTIGVATLSIEQKKKILELAGTVKAAEDFVEKYKEDFTKANKREYEKLKFKAQQAFDELSDMHGKKSNVWDNMGVMMQGNTLTLMSIVRNFGGNAVFQPIRGLEKILTSSMDYLVSQSVKTIIGRKLGAKKERTSAYFANQKGYFPGVAKGTKIGGKQLWYGVPNEDLANRELAESFKPIKAWAQVAKDVKQRNLTRKAIDNFTFALFGTPAEVTFRLLNFGDKPFSEGPYQAKAMELGTLKGLKGKELEKFIEFPDPDSLEKIKLSAQRATFQQSEGFNAEVQKGMIYALNFISKWPLIGPPAKLILKSQALYVKTPLNIIALGIDYAVPPFSIIKGIFYINRYDGKADRELGLQLIARGIVGQVIISLAGKLIENGLLTGSADKDEKIRTMEFEERPPKRLNINGFLRMAAGGDPKTQKTDNWIDYNPIPVIGLIFSIEANKAKIKKDNKDQNKAIVFALEALSTIPSIFSAALEQSFLSQTNSLMNAIKDGGYSLDKWAVSTVATLSNIAIPNTITSASRASNEYMPDTRANNIDELFLNTIKTRYFQGNQLPPKVSMWGEPIKQTPEGRNKFLYHFIDPTKFNVLNKNDWSYKVYELYMATDDKESLPSVPSRNVTITNEDTNEAIKATSAQYSQYCQMVGKARARLVRATIESNEWNELTNEQKMAILKSQYDSGAAIGLIQFKETYKK